MAGAAITAEIDSAQLTAFFAPLQGQNLSAALKNIGEYGLTRIDRRFKTQTDPQGQPWRPLARSTVKTKARRGKRLKILQQDGDLRRTIVYRVDRDGVVWGTNRPYAAIHQFGGRVKRRARKANLFFKIDKRTGRPGRQFVKKGKSNFVQEATIGASEHEIPARPYLGFNDQEIQEMGQIVVEFWRPRA